MACRIFVNYRRNDAPEEALAIYHQLLARHKAEQVFLDVDGRRQPGEDFIRATAQALQACEVLLVVIGRHWEAYLRWEPSRDFVIAEIEIALQLGKRVIPLLVCGANVPSTDVLPVEVRPFARCQALALGPGRVAFDEGVQRLLQQLDGRTSIAQGDASFDLQPHLRTLSAIEARLDRALGVTGDMPVSDPMVGRLQLPTLSLPKRPEERSPAQLLDPRYGAVHFDEGLRQVELNALQELCEDRGRGVRLKLFAGPGGAGKTRLLMHFCHVLRQRANPRWHAGFLLDGQEEAVAEDLKGRGAPTFVVIDYAEGRALGPWLRRLTQTELPRVVRIVLLARHAGDWWETLPQGDAAVAHLCLAQPVMLREIAVGAGERLRQYQAASTAFAKVLEKPVTQVQRPRLVGDHFGRPLYIHMAALMDMLSESPMSETSEPQKLPWQLMQREARFWGLTEEGSPPWPAFRVMAGVTLRGGAVLEDVEHIAASVSGPRSDRFFQHLLDLYPHHGGVGPVEPDLLGEALVCHVLSSKLTRRSFLDRVLQGATSAELRQCMTVLGRIAVEYPEIARIGARQVLASATRERSEAAFDATLALSQQHVDNVVGQELASALQEKHDPELARKWHLRLPESSVAMREVALWVYRQLHAAAETELERAEWGLALGVALRELGRLEEALEVTQNVVSSQRGLVEAGGTDMLAKLGTALASLGRSFSDLGRREAALDATQEAVDIFAALVRDGADEYLPKLAKALNHLGVRFNYLGRRDEALAATQEAVRIRRRLAATLDPDLDGLAASLNNLAMNYRSLGYKQEALAAALEAADLVRRIAETYPDAYQPYLALCLNNLGVYHTEVGHADAALAATEEAVKIRRRLVEARPQAFMEDLAVSLTNLGTDYSRHGRKDDALAAAEESVALYRQLAAERPEGFLPGLAVALHDLGNRQGDLDKHSTALATTDEAITLLRSLGETRPDTFLPDLARTLTSRSRHLSEMGRKEEAVAAAEEALALYGPLSDRWPRAFVSEMAEVEETLRGLSLLPH